MKGFSWILIILGIILILTPVIGNIYTSYSQQNLYEEIEKQTANTVNPVDIDIIKEYGELAETFKNIPGNSEPADSIDKNNSSSDTEEPSSTSPSQTSKPIQPKLDSIKPIGIMSINKIGLKIPVVEGVTQECLSMGTGHMPGTATPGEVGNAVLAGHRSYTFGTFFNRLDELDNGDEITITSGSDVFTYIVYEKKIIEPTDTSVLSYNNVDRRLTLITCHPPFSSTYRLVVQARVEANRQGQVNATP